MDCRTCKYESLRSGFRRCKYYEKKEYPHPKEINQDEFGYFVEDCPAHEPKEQEE